MGNEDLLGLAERCEQATADDQRDLLTLAFEALRGPIRSAPRPGMTAWNPHWERFRRMLDAEAFESAAMTLVGSEWRVGQFEESWLTARWHCRLVRRAAEGIDYSKARAATPALALCAARARASLKDSER